MFLTYPALAGGFFTNSHTHTHTHTHTDTCTQIGPHPKQITLYLLPALSPQHKQGPKSAETVPSHIGHGFRGP